MHNYNSLIVVRVLKFVEEDVLRTCSGNFYCAICQNSNSTIDNE